jgi:hypothetical protein
LRRMLNQQVGRRLGCFSASKRNRSLEAVGLLELLEGLEAGRWP